MFLMILSTDGAYGKVIITPYYADSSRLKPRQGRQLNDEFRFLFSDVDIYILVFVCDHITQDTSVGLSEI